MNNYNIFNLVGEICQETENRISDFLTRILESNDERPILLLINSSGGNVTTGFSIYNKLCAMPNDIITVITGQCSSIANVIFFAAEYKNRYAFDNTFFFMHSIRTSVKDYTPAELRQIHSDSIKTNIQIESIIKANTSIPYEILNSVFGDSTKEMRIFPEDFDHYSIAKLITKFDEIGKLSDFI